MSTMLQFLGSMRSNKETAKKYSNSTRAGRREMYHNFMGGGTSAPSPKPAAGRLASQTGGRTASAYQTKGA